MEQLVETECSGTQISHHSQNEFLKYEKEELFDLLTHLETELEAREIAFNVLKLKFSKRDISLYYGCVEALQCDGFMQKYNEEVDKLKSKEIKSFYDGHKESFHKLFTAKNKAIFSLKFQLQTLQERYENVCQILLEDKDKLQHFKNEFVRFRESSEKDNNTLQEKYGEVSNERNKLLDRVQSLQEDLELTRKKCQMHKDGGMLLMRDRNWLAQKVNHLIGLIDRLEGSLQITNKELNETKTELAKLKSDHEIAQNSLSRSREDLNCEFSKIISSKDAEISKLKKENDRLKTLSLNSSIGPDQFNRSFTESTLLNGLTKDVSRVDCKSVYDNMDIADVGGSSSPQVQENVWLPRETSRMSPFCDTATIKRGSFVKPQVSEDFSGFDIFGREMADLQELLVSMASPPNDNTCRQNPADIKVARSDQSLPKPLDLRTFLLSIQTAISNGNASKLRELVQQQQQDRTSTLHKLPIGILPLHYAVECCSEACVKVLLECGFDANVQNEEKMSAMHIASSEGSIECLKVLMEFGASMSLTNHIGMTPLHCAASSGHVDCCILLLQSGARIDALNLNNWTPLHVCTFSGHSQCLQALLTFRTSDKSKDEAYDATICDVINMADKDGCTLAFLASSKETKDCLEVLAQCCTLDLQARDKWNRSVLDVASQACLSFLLRSESTQEITCCIAVDAGWDSSNVPKSGSTNQLGSSTYSSSPMKAGLQASKTKRSCSIGSMTVSKTTNWAEVEEKLGTAFLNHVSEISIGLRTKKISRSEQESPDTPNPFTMGLTVKSIKYFSIGRYHWSPGTLTEKSPFEMLTTHNTSLISIKLFGLDNNCPDSLAYDSLIPIYVLQNYLRLVQQYKSVVFYGPKGVGKSYLVKRLASYIQTQESSSGFVSEVSFTTLQSSFTNNELVKLLIEKGCLIDSKQLFSPPTAPILVFDDLTQVSVDDVFKEISSSIENRGPNNKIFLKNEDKREASYYMHPNCYIICTMDKSRSTGLELSLQQRFKWVQLRCDQEPSKYLLHRHLLRNLADSHQGSIPLPDNSVYKAVEWLICVWQRLNDGIVKLGLLDLVFGPCYFLPCPIEKNKPKAILRWLISLWNQVIAPTISEAVIKSSGSVLPKEGDSQQKVTSTALYVLMQRAVVPGCPLAGQERDRYLACFNGSNELDIKVKSDKRDVARPSHLDSPNAKFQFKIPEVNPVGQYASPQKDSTASFMRFHSSNEALGRTSKVSNMLPTRPTNELIINSPAAPKQLG